MGTAHSTEAWGLVTDDCLQSVFFDFAVKGAFADLEDFSGFGAVVIGHFEGSADMFFLDLLKRFAEHLIHSGRRR